jgi:UDP-glucuronate 4-epimerase
MDNNKILVTGSAGFIGYHLSKRLCEGKWNVVGADNLNNYYDPTLKESRLNLLNKYKNFTFYKIDLSDRKSVMEMFSKEKFSIVINLAAQAGVRYSLTNPYAYIESNIDSFLNILEACRNYPVAHLIYASSSSVYGANTQTPFSVHQNVDHPLSLYAATKKSNELMAHTYANLYNIPTTGLRFFTVYGPWGRPDMAAFIFIKAILEESPIDVYNFGNMERDFTYIDDIVEGIFRLINKIPEPSSKWNSNSPDPAISFAPYRLFNIGNNQPVKLLQFIEIIENLVGIKAVKNFLPLQPGDVPATCAEINDLIETIDFKPETTIETGLKNFVDWYKDYYKISF